MQLVASLDNARYKWLTPATVQVDLKPLARVIAELPNLRLAITGRANNADDDAIRKLLSSKQVYFDFANVADGESSTTFAKHTSTMRFVFGSGMPLHSIESARTKLQTAKLSNEERSAIASQTAARLIDAVRKPR